jgi:hypothetical protein
LMKLPTISSNSLFEVPSVKLLRFELLEELYIIDMIYNSEDIGSLLKKLNKVNLTSRSPIPLFLESLITQGIRPQLNIIYIRLAYRSFSPLPNTTMLGTSF